MLDFIVMQMRKVNREKGYYIINNFLLLPTQIMTARVLTTFWRFPSGFRTHSRKITVHLSSLQIPTATAATSSIFEPIPREELVTKFKSRLRDRQFLPGSTGGGFPEFLAEPRDSFPLGVRVNNRNQSSLAQLTEKHGIRGGKLST